MTSRTEDSRAATSPHGFTLIELLITLTIAAVLIAVLLPAVAKTRNADRTAVSQSNLRSLGQASIRSAYDNAFAIPSFSPSHSTAQREVIELLGLLTGRGIETGEPDQLVPLTTITPQRRYQHLRLADYLTGSATEPVAASPFDRNLLGWQRDPVFAQDNTVPYHDGTGTPGTDRYVDWERQDVRQMWPYSSSYQTIPAGWNPDGPTDTESYRGWYQSRDTPHLFITAAGAAETRLYQQIAFPSHKVHMFEEFDGLWRQRLWFAYPLAQCNLLFFDGSVRRLRSEESNPGWNPSEPNNVWKQRYRPLDTFPWYAHGYRNRDELPMRYRWTREGLAGIDFGGRDVNVPPQVRADPEYRSEVYPRYTNFRPVKAHTGERQSPEP